ncbi:Ltp family lipoprotein [Gordonia sp. CPCC 205515]|uniref:Ltp family lipoprotein n=1 Tax=Gordonia sp. CPCC 205515 TaxID=3140791 RepID=UPI003AF36BC6
MSQRNEGWGRQSNAVPPQSDQASTVGASSGVWPWLVGALAAFAVIGGIFSAATMPASTVSATGNVGGASALKPVHAPAVSAVVGASRQAPGAAIAVPVDYGRTAGQENAIGKAKDYLAYSAFSRTGLIKQLEFEGFTESDATFAVDSLKVNWNAQAVQKAKDYLSYSSFSHSGLVEQLEFEGFTAAQAEYGVRGAGL